MIMERKICSCCNYIIYRSSTNDPDMCGICEDVMRERETERAFASIV